MSELVEKKEERKISSFESLVDEYLNYSNESKQYEKELEVRFGTKGKIIKRDDFENVIKKISNCGFVCSDMKGKHIMRIMNEYDKNEVSISNIRTEIENIENIQHFCKFNRPPDNEFIKYQKKFNIKKDDVKILPHMNNDYNFKLSFQIEDNIHKQSPIIQSQLLEKWEQIPKSYRHMNRLEFMNQDKSNPIKYHLTIVKSSNKKNTGEYIYEKNIRNVDIFNKKESYEIEIELDNNILSSYPQTKENLIALLKKNIKYVLCGLQNTNYPVSYKQLNGIAREYLSLLKIEKPIDNVISKDFIGPSSITLQISNIIDDSNVSLENIRSNYSVTEKADGERRLLYICKKGNIYLIDTNMNIHFTGIQTKKKNIFSTILDGELILQDKYKKFINLFAAFDVYFINSVDRRELHFNYKEELKDIQNKQEKPKEGRLKLLEKVIKLLNNDIMSRDIKINFQITSKEFYYENNIFENCNKIITKSNDGLFTYNTDGLIFTPVNCGLPIVNRLITWEKSFKWKPPEFNTIDFLISIKQENGEELINSYVDKKGKLKQYKTLYLKCGFDENKDGYMNPMRKTIDEDFDSLYEKKKYKENTYKPYLFYPTNPYDETAHIANIDLTMMNGINNIYTDEEELIEHNTIVEFRYNLNNRNGWCWEPLRVRYDKTRQLRNNMKNYGNSYHTANNNWNSIHNPVTEKMITTGFDIPENYGDDDVYYTRIKNRSHIVGMRDFHNLYVKKLLINSISNPGDMLCDIAVGKGGDLPKWIDAKLSFVLGIDKSKDNIENRINGAYARYLNYKKKRKHIPEMLFLNGNTSKQFAHNENEGIIGEQYKLIYNALFGVGGKEESKIGKGPFKKYGIAKDGFQITSCQFACHYFFESVKSLENFIQNVIDVTEVGGYFIGTCYDGKKMFNYLNEVNFDESKTLYNENGHKIWEVTKQYKKNEFPDNVESLNYAIDVYQDSIDKKFTEYLVNFDYFKLIMEQYGFRLLNDDELKNIGLKTSIGSFKDLYVKMSNEITEGLILPENIGNALNMNEQEQKISFFNNYFIFKKVRHEISSVALLDTNVIVEPEITIKNNL